MDETYIRVKGEWKYLYRAVDSNGNTIDFMLSAKRNRKAAKRFLKKALGSKHNLMDRVRKTKEEFYATLEDESC